MQGFDEFMNVVIDETIQHYQPKKDGSKAAKASEELGRILLKGEFGLMEVHEWLGTAVLDGARGMIKWELSLNRSKPQPRNAESWKAP